MVEFDLGSLEGRYTRVEDFYVRNHYPVPEIAGSCSLQVEGEVEQPKTLTSADLNRLPKHTVGAVLECAGAPSTAVSLVSDGVWGGWRLSDVLSLAHPRGSGAYLHCFGRDHFARSVPTEDALSCGVLATTLNDRPLGRNHGAPLRLVFPGWYGMNSVKWLERIAVAEAPLPNRDDTYVEVRTQSPGNIESRPLPRIQVKSLITNPVTNSALHRGKVAVRGLAWSGMGTISSVEVNVGPGTRWIAARLDRPDSRYDWTIWNAVVELNRTGLTELVCRAVDDAGNTQPATRDPQRIDSYTNNVYHSVRCLVVAG